MGAYLEAVALCLLLEVEAGVFDGVIPLLQLCSARLCLLAAAAPIPLLLGSCADYYEGGAYYSDAYYDDGYYGSGHYSSGYAVPVASSMI